MARVRYVSKMGVGDMLALHLDDGTLETVHALTNGRWRNFAANSGTPTPGPGGAGVMFTAQMVAAAVQSAGGSTGNMVDTADNIAASFNAANTLCGNPVTTKNRAATLLGECAMESAWFQTTKEYGGGAGQSYYPYCGRGFIQCTWAYNYRDFANFCIAKGTMPEVTSSEYFVNNMSALEDLKYAALTGFWYFSKKFSGKTLWEWADSTTSPWSAISGAINTGSVNGTASGQSIRAAAINAVLAVTPDPAAGGSSGGTSALQTKLADWMLAHEGRYYYTQGSGRLDPDGSGGTDCSGLMRHAYQQVVGVIIGTYTGNECNYGTVLASGNGAIPAATIATLKPGDLVFATWSGHNPTWDHVGMFIGKGTYGANGWMDHGGNPNYGPVQRNLATYSSNFSEWQINRCV